jgi:hypothetical protein
MHAAAVYRSRSTNLKQTSLNSVVSAAQCTSNFANDLCDAFISANIPLHKLNNPKLTSFLGKYTQQHIPSETTVRKKCVPMLYDDVLTEVRKRIGDNYIYACVDETTDVRGNYIAHLLIGILSSETPGNAFLIASGQLEKTNASTICTFVNDSLVKFYNGSAFSDKVLLLVTDAAPYMTCAGTRMTAFYPNMIHVTCVAHGIHRICEKVRECFPEVNSLISCARKIFLKCPARIEKYKEKMNCPLPPEVVVTRWGTWINAAVFFANIFQEFTELISELNDDSAQLKKCKELIADAPTLPTDLAFIKSYVAFLPECITKLETHGLSLNSQIEIIEEVSAKIGAIRGRKGRILQEKCAQVFGKNSGYTTLRKLNTAFVEGLPCTEISRNPKILSAYLYAPLVSVDVERSFSEYKFVLSDRRQSFAQENLEKHLFIMHNSKLL